MSAEKGSETMAKKTALRKRRTRSDIRRVRPRTNAPVARQRRAQALRPSNQRIAPNVRRPTVPRTKLVPGPAIPLNRITARPPFQLPFNCGQTWRASTYDGHYPDQDSLDLLRFNGTTNISANEDVLASAAGTVIEAHDTNTEDPPYGSVVTIEHNVDWKTQYIHLDDALSVKKDDKVGRGQKIGTVGGKIAIFGTANAHLHYTQWFRANGVRSVFNGVATAVHAGAKDANGNYPTENLVSANCPVAAAGIARSGDWANSYWISTSRSAFEQKAQQLFDDRGLRLIHVHTYVEGGQRLWMGIARSGDWASSFWISNSRAAFAAKAQDLFDDHGRRLTFVQTYVEGGTRRWIGIAQGGNWANSFWISEGFTAFNTKAQQLFDQQGRRLVHVHTYVEANKRFWVGIARSGNWANSFWLSSNVDSFNFTAQDLFDEKGRRLTVVEFLSP
jgi:murein DD-endopeptidase MepM/ murein hydrolase activator NlpD